MVVDGDLHVARRFDQVLGDAHVLARRRRVSAWVVVDDDQRRCAELNGAADDLADVDRYADQRVLVRGLYNSTPHQGYIYDPEDPECRSVPLSFSPDRPRNSRASQVIRAAFVRNEFARVPIVVSGVVRPSVRQENGQQVVYVSCPCIEEAVTVAARQP